MKYITDRYSVFPAVVKANEKSRVFITAAENIFLPFEERKYTVRINAYDSDMLDYHDNKHKSSITASLYGGRLCFDFEFGAEGEYKLELLWDDKLLQSFKMYALEKELYDKRPLKGDFHAHSYRSDGSHDPGALAGFYREQGYDFMTLTDHNRYFPSEELREAYREVKLGLTVINGEEVHTPGSIVHIVHVGGKSSVADIYYRQPERYKREYKEIENAVSDSVPEQFRERFAMAKWAVKNIHDAGGMAIFAHPFWHPEGSGAYNVCEKFSDLLLKSGMFDAYELVGNMKCVGINMSVAMWNDMRASGFDIPVVGSSDVHNLESKDFAYHFTIVFAKNNTPESILDAVKRGYSVAVEMSCGENDREYRCYGSLRLVTYAQFLLNTYFPQTRQIAAGEGVAMRRYLVGMEDGALLSAMHDRVDAFYRRFFGTDEPPCPSAETLEYENKWRDIQLKSPDTRGSNLVSKNKRYI